MISIAAIGTPALAVHGSRRGPQAGFVLPSSVSRPAMGGAVAAPSAGGLLGLQEQEDGAARDRNARRQGQAVLEALAGVQRDLLAGRLDAAGLELLAAGVAAMPQAADPALRSVLNAVALRARVELARLRTRAESGD
jgi:Class II flagellar assembly regulator